MQPDSKELTTVLNSGTRPAISFVAGVLKAGSTFGRLSNASASDLVLAEYTGESLCKRAVLLGAISMCPRVNVQDWNQLDSSGCRLATCAATTRQ